ncbi:MAG: DHH family phosphoesterase [Oscillibacter sp.]|nr:DHH family phosphoesterase [Oscillibacter sp.]
MLSVKDAAAYLRTIDNILILTHARPDGDTVGCAAALCAALRALGKTAFLLPNGGLTEHTAPFAAPYAAPDGFVPQHVVSVDLSARKLLPENALPYRDAIDLAIDHHPSFEAFGRQNLLRAEAAACGEIIYDIVRELGEVTPEIALPLYLAVSTDTGGFIYANVTAQTHRVAAALIETGIDYRAVNKEFFQTKSRVRLELEAAMLGDAEFYHDHRVVFLRVPLSLMERMHATEGDAEDLSSLAPQIQGVTCAVTLRELQKDVWKISVRTVAPISANGICALLGGGGHDRAAGATIKNASYEEARERMLGAIEAAAPQFKK